MGTMMNLEDIHRALEVQLEDVQAYHRKPFVDLDTFLTAAEARLEFALEEIRKLQNKRHAKTL